MLECVMRLTTALLHFTIMPVVKESRLLWTMYRLHCESDGSVARLTNKELEVLLKRKGLPVFKMGNMASNRALYQQFAGDRGVDNLVDPAC